MNTYITIIGTFLVICEIIRVIQNHAAAQRMEGSRMVTVSFPVSPGDCLFAKIGKNVVKYNVDEIRVFGKNLRYLICISATDYFKANVYGYDRKMEIVPEHIGRYFFVNPDDATKDAVRRADNG